MNRIVSTLAGLGVALLVGTSSGCTGSGYTTVGVSATYRVPAQARLVYAGNGLWVVADQDYPTFYSNGYYWLHGDGVWYRSARYDGGWARVHRVPRPLYTVRQPSMYVHYKVRPGVRWRAIRDHHQAVRGERRVIRDHRRRN